MSMKNPRVARRYARALMTVAEEQKSVDATSGDMALVAHTLGGSRELKLMLASPIVAETRKASILRELFAGRVSELSLSFIELLVRKHRQVFLEEVIVQFQFLRDELRGVITVDVTSAVALQADQVTSLTAALERRTGKQVRLQIAQDARIKGGLVIKIGDTVLDASVMHQLARLREQFAGGAHRPTT